MSNRFYHPDDEPSPRFGTWADDFNTYEEACEFYGADSRANLLAEAEYEYERSCVEWQDEIETKGPRFYVSLPNDELPF